MDNLLKIKQKGIASLFDKEELKKFFKNYLILIAIAETFVFFVSFVSQLGPDNTPFPWESYFFAAFIIPIAITFLLGVCIMGFNTYLFGEESEEGELTYAFDGDDEATEPDYPVQVGVVDDGPLWVSGRIPVTTSTGVELERRARVTLCRCGQSSNKPLCDGSHAEAGFTDVHARPMTFGIVTLFTGKKA